MTTFRVTLRDRSSGEPAAIYELHGQVQFVAGVAYDSTELREIETQKAKLAPGDDSLVALSEAAEDLAKRIADKATSETTLAKEATAAG